MRLINCTYFNDVTNHFFQDVQYADIDYMDEQAIFTLGANFTQLPDYVSTVKSQGVRFILILDPFVNTEKADYATHDNAMAADVYIKWYNDTYQPPKDCATNPTTCQNLTDVMLGYVRFLKIAIRGQFQLGVVVKVWPVGRAAFPDFFKPSAQNWWIEEVRKLHKDISFDGLLIVRIER